MQRYSKRLSLEYKRLRNRKNASVEVLAYERSNTIGQHRVIEKTFTVLVVYMSQVSLNSTSSMTRR